MAPHPTAHTCDHPAQTHTPTHATPPLTKRNKILGVTGLVAAGAIGALSVVGVQSCGKKKGSHFDPINVRGGYEQTVYDNNMTQVSMERVLDSLMMIKGTNTSLQTDAFQGLYDWLDKDVFEGKKSVWKPITWFDNSKHAHKNGNMNTHYEMMLEEVDGENIFTIRWHGPTPTAQQKADGCVSDHKVAFSQYVEGDTRIKRMDYYSNKQHPDRNFITTFDGFKGALEELGPVFQ